jgi:hypothetical protein
MHAQPPPLKAPAATNLRPCPSCTQAVSWQARFCVHCGHSFERLHSVSDIVLRVLLTLVVVATLAGIIGLITSIVLNGLFAPRLPPPPPAPAPWKQQW